MQLSGFAAGPYATNTYLLTRDDHAVVVDPGMHTHDRIVTALNDAGLTLDCILLTHGHIDHTRDAGQLAKTLKVSVYIHPEDEFMLSDGQGVSPQTRIVFDADNMTPIEDLRFLNDGDSLEILGDKLKIAHAPGHSPGSVLLVHEKFCLSGDVVFKGSIGRTDLPHSDPAAMQESLRGPVAKLNDELMLLPGHGAVTTMGAERRTNPFLIELGI